MIKGFGIFSFFVFLVLCIQIGEFGPGFAVWFLSLLLVCSGTISYSLFLYPVVFENNGLKKIQSFSKINLVQLIKVISEISTIIRKDGLLATETIRKELKDPWLQYALKKMLDGFEKPIIIQVIRNEQIRYQEKFILLDLYKDRVVGSIALFGLAGSLSHILYFLSKNDPTLIAASFVPFLFSLVLQLVINSWIQSKIDFLTDQSKLYYAVLENGISGIQDGVNSDILHDQLMARINHA